VELVTLLLRCSHELLAHLIIAAASLTIPSALALLIGIFPEPKHQAIAIASFGAWGAMGIGERPLLCNAVYVFTMKTSVLGLITGALFVEYVSWSWVFWFVSTVIIPTTLISALLIPSQTRNVVRKSGFTKFRSLDIIGILILTGQLQFQIVCSYHTEHSISCRYTLYICYDNRVYRRLGISHDTSTFGHRHRHNCCILFLGGLPVN